MIGSAEPEADAELIVLLAELLDALGIRDRAASSRAWAQPETRAEYREELMAYLRAHEDRVSAEVRSRIELNPLRAFDAGDPGTRAVMSDAPRLLDRLAGEDAEHFARCERCSTRAGIRYQVDPTLVRGLDYYTRTLFEFQATRSGAQSARRRRWPVRPPDRAARRPVHPGLRLGGRGRADAARQPASSRSVRR